MAISVTFSSSNGGLGLSAPVDHGNIANGSTTTPQTIYIRHDGVNPITSTTVFCTSVDNSEYAGSFTAAGDKTELLAWGNAGASGDFGGIQFNFNASGSFPGSSWPTFSNKTTVDGFGYTIRTGVGDSSSNGIAIPSAAGASSLGTIQAGASPNVRFSVRIVVPENEDIVGIRQFRMSMSYNYTS
jgi:hypothetical protein